MRAERLLNLMILLQNRRRTTAADLAAQLGVSVRTVQRDLDALSLAGVPVYAERGRGGGVRLHDGYATRLTALSPAEAEALALVTPPPGVADLDAERDLGAALEKVAAAIPAVHRLRARDARNRLMVDTVPWFHEAAADALRGQLDVLRRAVWDGAVCRLDYRRGDGRRKRYRVEPYALVAKVDLWYLVARTGRGMRVFRLSRIVALEVTSERFTRDAGFDLHRFWRRWCQRFESRPIGRYWVTLDLTAEARARLLDRYGGWHAEALAAWNPAEPWNRVTLDLENEEIAARVLFDLAGSARVLAPETLRRALAERARVLLADLESVHDGA
ncbi:MAG TPA: YafY family protein [Pseudomonadales bacterium]